MDGEPESKKRRSEQHDAALCWRLLEPSRLRQRLETASSSAVTLTLTDLQSFEARDSADERALATSRTQTVSTKEGDCSAREEAA